MAYIEKGNWPLAAVPVKRKVAGRQFPQIGVVFKNTNDQRGSYGQKWPFILVVCDPEKLECVFTFATHAGVTEMGTTAMVEKGEPYSAQMIVEIGWRVD
tara:strand:- start:259 stop:555 length:297 start_codon:yes stop_codon:yes gene_type:complete